jgi:acetyl esterase/lipase
MLLDSADFVPPGARERLTAAFLRWALRLALKPALSPQISIAAQRRRLKNVSRVSRPSNRVDIQSGTVGNVTGDWLRPRRPAANTGSSATILYLHGGGYCIGSPATHRAVTSHLAQATGLVVFAAGYRLAPEYPFPAAVEDAVAVYRSLNELGPVMIAGDSAGGGLALATALAVRQHPVAAPAALVLFSPWIDLTPAANSVKAPKGEAMLSPAMLNACASHYLAGADAASPLASPVYADLRGLPPTLIQAGTDEMLYGQAVRLHNALLEAGVAVRCEIAPGRWHVFQLHAGMLPSATAAIERAGNFIRRNIAP